MSDIRLEAGYATRDITPPRGVELCGFGYYLGRTMERIESPLNVRCCVLRAGTDTVCMLSTDLIGFSVTEADRLRALIAADLGIDPVRVLLASTHTHAGPATVAWDGIGEMNPDYVAELPGKLRGAAIHAAESLEPVTVRWRCETIEPFGINRRHSNFCQIDPRLKTLWFDGAHTPIVITSYACHPVHTGADPVLSADWPGAVCECAEQAAARALVLQGFCGDIDPVSWHTGHHEHWPQEVASIGRHVWNRVRRARHAPESAVSCLPVAERRLPIPLNVPTLDDLKRDATHLLQHAGSPGHRRFAEVWIDKALAHRDEMAANPFTDPVPIWACRIGCAVLCAVPFEPFSGHDAVLRAHHPDLMTIGYANGLTSYLPTRDIYECPGDYAAYEAPRFFSLFPFTPDAPDLVMNAALQLITDVQAETA